MESTSDIALEIADMISSREAGHQVDIGEANEAAERLLNSVACTPLDALACVTLASRLLNAEATEITPIVQDSALALMKMATDALERTTGQRATIFAGKRSWH